MSIRSGWAALGSRFLKLQARERALVAVTVVVCVLMLGWQFAIAPELRRAQQAQAQTTALRQEAGDLASQLAQLEAELAKDPNAPLRQQRAQLQGRFDELQSQLEKVASGLVGPEAMVDLLRKILSHHRELNLESVSHISAVPLTLPGVGGVPDGAVAESGENSGLYRHGITVTVTGRYLHLLDYLRELEALDDRLGWSALHYEVQEWPEGRLQIHLKTLSLSEEWLGV